MTVAQLPPNSWSFFAWWSGDPDTLAELFELLGRRLIGGLRCAGWAEAFQGAETWRCPSIEENGSGGEVFYVHASAGGWQLLCEAGEAGFVGEAPAGSTPFLQWTVGGNFDDFSLCIPIPSDHELNISVSGGRVRCTGPLDVDGLVGLSRGALWRSAKAGIRNYLAWNYIYAYRTPFQFRFPERVVPQVLPFPRQFTVHRSLDQTLAGLGVPAALWPELAPAPSLLYAAYKSHDVGDD